MFIKVSKLFTIFLTWSIIFIASPAFAQWNINNPISGKATSLQAAIALIFNIAFSLAAIVALGYLIMGGFSYVTAGGNPEAAEGAKTSITNAIVGLVLILLSYLVIRFLLQQLGADDFIQINPGPGL